MKRVLRACAWIAVVAVVAAFAIPSVRTRILNRQSATPQQADNARKRDRDGPTPVLVARARKADVPVYVEGVGTGQALNSVLIRSQVDGVLNKLAFTEGQDVKAGELIAKIDPRLYQATLDQNVAKKALDEATLLNARRDLDRYKLLAQTKAGTQQQYDTQVAVVAQDVAQVAIDQALIDSARTTLSYTDVTSPIAGRTGIRNVDVGNVIHATDTTGIVTVSQIQPISVIFNVPQQELPRINKASLGDSLDVQAVDANGDKVVDHGKLAVVNNTIDATTGTVKLKANFANPQLQLWPGIFVNVRLLVETLHDAIVIPVGALQRGPKGPFVFSVANDKAVMRPITVGQQDDTQAVVSAGLAPGDLVITSGFQKLTDGAPVHVGDDKSSTTAAAPALHEQGVTPGAPAQGAATGPDGAPVDAPRHRGGQPRRPSAGE
jgi:multidrug efflux system membrane fusion protein